MFYLPQGDTNPLTCSYAAKRIVVIGKNLKSIQTFHSITETAPAMHCQRKGLLPRFCFYFFRFVIDYRYLDVIITWSE